MYRQKKEGKTYNKRRENANISCQAEEPKNLNIYYHKRNQFFHPYHLHKKLNPELMSLYL